MSRHLPVGREQPRAQRQQLQGHRRLPVQPGELRRPHQPLAGQAGQRQGGQVQRRRGQRPQRREHLHRCQRRRPLRHLPVAGDRPGGRHHDRQRQCLRPRHVHRSHPASEPRGGRRQGGRLQHPADHQPERPLHHLQLKAANLAPGVTHRGDVYVWDRVSDTNRRLSVADNGGNANGESLHAEIGYDGTYIAFQSQATNLVVGDTNGKTDVFRVGNPFLGISTNMIRASVSRRE